VLGIVILSFFILIGQAVIKLPVLIANGMILQRGVPNCIYGSADVGEKAVISFLNQKITTIAYL